MRRRVPEILLNNAIRIFVLERQHAATSVFDQHDLLGAKKLLGDDDAAESVLCGCSRLVLC